MIRFWIIAVVLALVVGATKVWAGRSSRPTTLPLPLALRAGVVAVSLVSLAGSVPVAVGWSDYVASFQAGVRAHTGSISVLALRVPSTLSGTYGWPWTNPFVGIEVADGSGRTGVRNIGNVTVAINTFGDQVFSYAQAPSLATLPPSLHHYGW